MVMALYSCSVKKRRIIWCENVMSDRERVSAAAAVVGSALGVKPILSLTRDTRLLRWSFV